MSYASSVPFKVKTNFAWSGEKKDDLGFLEGDFIEVTKVSGEWFYGRLIRNKKQGYFPSNYVTLLEEQYNSFLSSKNQDSKNASRRYQEHAKSVPDIPTRSLHVPRKRYVDDDRPAQTNVQWNHSMEMQSKSALPQSYSTSNIPNIERHYDRINSKKDYVQQPPLPPIPKSSSTPMFSHISNGRTSKSDGTESFGRYSQTQYMQDSFASSEESFAIMSDFSATSAGSFARHNFARSFQDSVERSAQFESKTAYSKTNAKVQVNKDSKLGGLLKKWIPGNNDFNSRDADYPKLPDIQSLNISNNNHDANDWVEAESQLRRALTITTNERRERGMRATSKNVDLLLYPHSVVNRDLYSNEVLHSRQPGIVDEFLCNSDFKRVDKPARQLFKDSAPSKLSVESFAQYSFPPQYFTPLEQLRGLFIFCTEFFRLIDDNGKTNFNRAPDNLDKALERRYCTPYELTWLFKRMSSALKIDCEIVFGFLKTPNADNTTFRMNHCWLQVKFYEEWRFVDVILGNITNPIHEYLNNKPANRCEFFYFLTAPMDLINTHVPREYSKQHIVPELDLTIVLSLPVVFPSFFKNRLRLHKFSNGLTDLEDNEIFECTLRIPNDIEVFSNIVVDGENSKQFKTMDLSLVQVLSQNKRTAVIKAVLPPGTSKGTLFIHSGIKGTQRSIENIHPISMIVPLTVSGSVNSFEFVSRIPSEALQRVEVYIKEPQNKILSSKRKYKFEMIQNPSDGIINQSIDKNINHAMLILSPSGKKYKLIKNDPNIPFGTWHTYIEINEVGKWNALILSDSGSGWCEFAQWESK